MIKLLLALLFPCLAFGQTIYKGTIINKSTKEKIPFATVGLVKENKGTNANENGEYIIDSKAANPNDTIIISSVGFQTLKIPISKITSTLELEERATILKEVVVNPKREWIYAKLSYQFGHSNIGITTFGTRSQIAKYFAFPADRGILTEVKIFKSSALFESRKGLFRLRIYDCDTATMAPSEDLCNQVIEVNSDKRVVTIDLEKYHIHVSTNFFVAVEWLVVPYNEHRFKSTNEQSHVKSEYVEYRPYLAAINFTNRASIYLPGTSNPVWLLNYNDKWMPWPIVEDVGIGAKVKY